MQKYYVAIILGILFLAFVLAAVRAWKARANKQEADFSQPPMALIGLTKATAKPWKPG